jgi:AAA+ ATPase superfamily predicted ATPase
MQKEYPLLIRLLTDTLKYRLRMHGKALDFDYYILDLSSLKLRLTDYTPFIHILGSQLDGRDPRDLVSDLKTVIANQYFQKYIPIIVVEGVSEDLRDAIRTYLPYCVMLDANDVQTIVTGSAMERRLLEAISSQIPISSLSPYEISSPVTGSRFFGREYEIRTIINHPTTNYAIVGNRRIGKTSLMLEIKRRQEEDGEEHNLFFDCSDFSRTDSYIQAVTTELDIRQRERMTLDKFPHFLQLQSRYGKKPILFFLDEVDHLINMDRQVSYELLKILRSSANQGFCRYIMTGYREVIEESVREQSYLFNFITPIHLGNLDRNDSHRLMVVPMTNLGVSFERENDTVNQIFQETAGNPNLIQFYCNILTQIMDRENRRNIALYDLSRVHSDSEFERFLIRTFTSNTDNLEKAIVYSLVRESERFTYREIDIALKKKRIFKPQNEIEQACDRLSVSGMLLKEGKTYTFAIPVLVRLLKEHYDVDYLFGKAIEDGKLAI